MVSALTVSLRKFLRNITVAFDGKKSFLEAAEYWNKSIATLRRNATELAGRLRSLGVSKLRKAGREIVMLGKIEGRRFAAMMRSARSARAFEEATGEALSTVARRAFRSIDEVAELNFPDVALARRQRYITDGRNDLIVRGSIDSQRRIATAADLERLVRSDARLLSRTNRLSAVASRTKKILYFGGAIVATTVGVAYVCRTAANHAANNTGCFIYTNSNGTIRRCRAMGCSCPTPIIVGKDSPVACRDSDLWIKMRMTDSDCSKATGDGNNGDYCVHCDWNETNSESLNFVDREHLPDDAYVRCERQDALDALNEMIGGTVDSAWDAVTGVGDDVAGSIGSVARIIPWILGAVAAIVIAAVFFALWRFVTPPPSSSPPLSSLRMTPKQ